VAEGDLGVQVWGAASYRSATLTVVIVSTWAGAWQVVEVGVAMPWVAASFPS